MALSLNMKVQVQPDFSSNPVVGYMLNFLSGNDEAINPSFTPQYGYNFVIGPLNTATSTFPTINDAIAYYAPIAEPLLLADINSESNNNYVFSGKTVLWLNAEEDRRLSALETGKFNVPTGTSSQVVLGDGTLGSIPGNSRTQSPLTLSLVGTGATGTQISATKDALVSVTVSTSATASISGAGLSTVAMKICSTNSATEANWTTVQTSETSQSYALAVAISGVTGGKGNLTALVPAGWYVKLVNSGSGTHSEAFVSGQQTIFN